MVTVITDRGVLTFVNNYTLAVDYKMIVEKTSYEIPCESAGHIAGAYIAIVC